MHDTINSLHGSDSEETAKKELQLFFPLEETVAVIKPDAEGHKGINIIILYLLLWLLSIWYHTK